MHSPLGGSHVKVARTPMVHDALAISEQTRRAATDARENELPAPVHFEPTHGSPVPALPEVLFSDATDAAQSKRVRRLAAAGKLRKLYAGIYTANLDAPAESVVLRHWGAITGHLLPGAVVSHRSAFEGKPVDGRLFVTRGRTRRTLDLPGLAIKVMPGQGALLEGSARDIPYGAIFLTSEPRRFLENLNRGRGWSERTLPQDALGAQVDKLLALRGEHWLNELRSMCKALAEQLDMGAEYKRLDSIVGALLGTHESRKLSSRQALARAAGRPYDSGRLEIFDTLFAALHREVFAIVADPAPTGAARENFAFFEAYFSNFIEGTTFTVDEAERIVFEGQIIENRSADSTMCSARFPPQPGRPGVTSLPPMATPFSPG